MKITCNIIRDLLPLYAEDLVSEDTRVMVDEHLRECEDCTKQFGIIKKAAQIPVDVDAGALKRVENTIRRKRVLAVLTALMLALTIVLGTALLLDARIYLTAEQAVDSVELLEDGSVFIRLTNYVIGYGSSRYPDNNIGFIAWTNLTKLLFGSKEHLSYEEFKSRNPACETQLTEEDYKYMGGFTHSDAQNCNIWYCNGWTGEGERLLWDGGDLTRNSPLLGVNYHLAYYCGALLVLSVIFALLGRYFSGKWYGELSIRLAILCGCLCLSTLLVTAGQLMEHYGEFTDGFVDGAAVGLPMTLTALFWRQLYLLNKQDKSV